MTIAQTAAGYAIGDSITFQAVTCSGDKPATRKVRGVDASGRPFVMYNGWCDFIVREDEIIRHDPR